MDISLEVFNLLLQRIASGEDVEQERLLPFLSATSARQRAEVNHALALAYMVSDRDRQARLFIERAWLLSHFSEEILEAYVAIHTALGDGAALRAAYKRVGMRHARAGDVERAIHWFGRWQFGFHAVEGNDHYEYDFDVLDAIRDMAAPHRLAPRAPAPGRRGRYKIAYLLFGANHSPGSALIRVAETVIRHHDATRFDVAFFVPYTLEELRASPNGIPAVESLRALGAQVVLAPTRPTLGQSLIGLAEAISDFQADLLAVQVLLADFRHYFVRCLCPAPVTLGFVYGALPQYASLDLDYAIAVSLHPQLDTPIDCRHVPGRMDLPRIDDVTPLPRGALGLPEDAVVVASCGRWVKLNAEAYWDVLERALRRHPDCHFLLVGASAEQLDRHLSRLAPALVRRVVCQAWRPDYLSVLATADILLDTFPSGGGGTVVDAVALGIPAVSFHDDYLQPYDQTRWSVGDELIGVPDLLAPWGDLDSLLAILSRLIADEDWRRQAGDRCRRYIESVHHDPREMVELFEQVYASLIDAGTQTVRTAVQSSCASPESKPRGQPGLGETTPTADVPARPLFSVLVPAYNHAAYLPAALDSLIAQIDPDWEAVVVDDGSTDATPAVLADYAARDARIRVFRQANGGAAAALNAGLAQARGEWICWLSADDLFEPDKLAIHRLAMAQRPDCHFFHGNFIYLDEADGQRRPSGVDAGAIMPPDGEQVIRLFRYNYVNGITVAVKREVFSAVGGFNTAYRNGQDFDMWLRITARHPWVYLDHPLAVTRRHVGQDTLRQPMGGIFDSALACLDFLNRHAFGELFPGVDLADPDQATVALRLALELLLDPNGYVNQGGLAVPLAERVVEWLAGHPAEEFRLALRQLVEAERFAGIDFPAELMAVWRRFAETNGALPYVARNLLAPLTERVRALAVSGKTQEAADLAAYLAVTRGRLAGLS